MLKKLGMAMTISDLGITVEDMSVERGGHVALTGITFDVGPAR